MYSTKTVTYGILQDILSQLTDYDIYSYYMGNFVVGKLYNSPLRSDDKVPSFAVFKGRMGNLMFKDHGSGLSGNAITFIKELKHISSNAELEKELLRIIKTTAPLSTRTSTRTYKSISNADIGIVRQDFTDVDKQYWKNYGISISTLQKFNVFSIKYFLCNKIVSGIYKDTNPMYAYKVNNSFKIYRPMNSKYTKWRSSLTLNDIQGYSQLPESGDILIITKSLKDVMVLYEMGYNAISPSSETSFIPMDIFEDLKKRFKHILILFDRDKTGVRRTRELSNTYKLDAFFVNKRFAAKDISDAVISSNFETVKQWLDKTLQKHAEQWERKVE